MPFVKGQSGNPSGRPRRDPLSDPAVLLAVERCLTWPLTRQPKTRAEVLAMKVIRKASRGGSLKPIYDAQERLTEYRKKRALQVAKPWDYGDDIVSEGKQAGGSQNPVSASTHENAHPEPITRQNTQQGAELDAMARLAAIQAKASPVPRFSVFGQPPKPEPIPADDRFDPLKGPLDAHALWAITHEPGWLSRPLPEQEPVRSAPSSLPYRIGIPGEQR